MNAACRTRNGKCRAPVAEPEPRALLRQSHPSHWSYRSLTSRATAAILLAAAVCPATSGAEPAEARIFRDIEYARVEGTSLKLDLHLPESRQPHAPLIVWVHGGAWRAGSKSEMPLRALVTAGYPIASLDYRLSTSARFPAQVHDIKAAIRFLRAEAKRLNVRGDRIVIAGNSAGGHLAALAGVSNGHHDLEGTVGDHAKESSAVQGIISYYGASNLTTILDQSTPRALQMRVPALELLLGAPPAQTSALARLASPVLHVDPNDPPLLLLHGDQDPQMPINQSHELCGAYENAKAQVEFIVVHGAAHGGPQFYDDTRTAAVLKFLQRYFSQPGS
jgi:acetyl esterase/lipase